MRVGSAKLGVVQRTALLVDERRRVEGLSEKDALGVFIKVMQKSSVSSEDWRTIYSELYRFSGQPWFWIIECIRSNRIQWKVKDVSTIKVRVTKESEGRWVAWSKVEGVVNSAYIEAAEDYGFSGNRKFYRVVDTNGCTVETKIEHFQKARSLAMYIVRQSYA